MSHFSICHYILKFINPFPHTTNLQQTKTSFQKCETSPLMTVKSLNISFPFCHNVFKSCLLQMHQNASTSGKGLNIDAFIHRDCPSLCQDVFTICLLQF